MIKWPEPAIKLNRNVMGAEWRQGYYTEAQLKQAVRDAYGEAAKKCYEYAELCEREQGQTTLYGHIRASAAQVLALEIRALIKEVV
jgi:hypothetical protein